MPTLLASQLLDLDLVDALGRGHELDGRRALGEARGQLTQHALEDLLTRGRLDDDLDGRLGVVDRVKYERDAIADDQLKSPWSMVSISPWLSMGRGMTAQKGWSKPLDLYSLSQAAKG
ncbi:MAG: hypothetical protein IPM79_06890 [Polyangiaceae bacterium]|nr:hypothetical protein [Polyangiaceae bacterium]